LQGLQDQLSAQVGSHRPANNPAAPGVNHDGQVQEPSPRSDESDIRYPEFIRVAGSEVTLNQVGGRMCIRLSLGSPRRFAAADTPASANSA
jgi:hypothetical protein